MASAPHIGPWGSIASAAGFTGSQPQKFSTELSEEFEAGYCLLPGGYVSPDGQIHREAVLRPLTGFDEEWLAAQPPGSFAVRIVTDLLTRCLVRVGPVSPVPRSVVSDLLVGDRDYLMLKLRAITLGERVDAVIECSNPTCGQCMDVRFTLTDLDLALKPVTQRCFQMTSTALGGEKLEAEFRLPTGADQEELASLFRKDESVAASEMFARCVLRVSRFRSDLRDEENAGSFEQRGPTSLDPAFRNEIISEIGRLAPQVVIELESACPSCGNGFVTPLDFTAFTLAQMKHGLVELEEDVHKLAWHYHWPERDVLSLSRRKRKRYIELVSREVDRAGGQA
ncbi:MAG TPA: hypothetical protein VFV34_18405 [Blastocatellia bacterium]|nr:hypothetical protein [Blastocatellia bacterium]